MTPRILLVDDHEMNIATLEAVLGPEGYDLHTATDGPAACEAVLRLTPDLVLLDVMMPGMDGFEVCRRIRRCPSVESVPVIMLTALNDRESRIAGIQAGADDFISKPFSVEELRARVRTITRLNRYRVIADQRSRFESLFELAPSAIVLVRADGIVVTANRRGHDLFTPLAPDPLPDRPLARGFPAAEADQLCALLAVVTSDQPEPPGLGPTETRVHLPAAAGERVFQVSATRFDATPEALVLLSFEDITAEVRSREQTESINRRLDALVAARTRQLEEANQLLMSYAIFVAHDLRSPLSAVKGYLSLLTDRSSRIDQDTRLCLEQAASATLMMEDMITDTLQLAADEHSDRRPETPIDPKPVIERLCWKVGTLFPRPRPRFVVHPLPLVLASVPLLERIFFNLISNALKYSSTRTEPRIEVGAEETPEGPVLFVRDNGIGIASAEADRLFAEFSRLPSAEGHDGLGLGLSLVSRLVRAHHGRIWAEGRPGEGAIFRVLLPAAAPAAPGVSV